MLATTDPSIFFISTFIILHVSVSLVRAASIIAKFLDRFFIVRVLLDSDFFNDFLHNLLLHSRRRQIWPPERQMLVGALIWYFGGWTYLRTTCKDERLWRLRHKRW